MLAYLSENADKRIIDALGREGYSVRALAPFGALSEPVSTHADMLLLAVGDRIFKHENYMLEGDFSNIRDPMSAKYPFDVPLNIAIVGKHAILNEKHASKTVLDYLSSNGFAIHHVAQGYAHCSSCIVSENALITADEGIFEVAKRIGIDALKIGAGHISLPPYDYGFIGGASGVSERAVYFCGSLKYHPDGDKIRLFVENHGKKVVELLDAPLSDIGGILLK